jgi:hypothetical protein
MDVVANPSVIWATRICSDVTQPLTPAITFVAHVNDPQDLVALVHVSILGPGGGPPLWNSYLNWTTTRPTNQKEYRGTLQNPSDVLNSVDSAHWQAIAYDRDGHQVQIAEGVITVQLIDCNQISQSQPHPGIAPPPTQTPAPEASDTASPTPQACIWEAAANVFLRKGPDVGLFDKLDSEVKGKTLPIVGQSQDGQFWVVQVSPKVIGYVTKAEKYSITSGDCSNVPTVKDPEPPEINLPPTKKPGNSDSSGGSSGVDCSSYTTDSSCNAAPGCSYDYGAKACK